MKPAAIIFILSIFWAYNICTAHKTEGQYRICKTSGKLLPLNIIKNLAKDSCDKILFTDAEGNKYEILSYSFAIAPKKGGNAYFETASGSRLTPTIKERLAKSYVNDMVVFSNIECITNKGTKCRLKGFSFSIIP